MTEFHKKMAEILEVDSLQSTDLLSKYSTWDSLGVLTFIAMVDSDYNLKINAKDIKDLQTVEELENLINSKLQ